MIVGVDIGGHHIAAALVDGESGRIVGHSYRHRETDRMASSDALLTAWVELIEDVIQETSAREATGIGIAMPGPFDYRTGVALFKGNGKFESLYGVNVREELQRRTSRPSEVRFLNDATAFAVGCVAMAAAPRDGRVLALTLGTGLGSAFLENGIPVIEGDAGLVPPDGCLWHLPFKDRIADDYVSSRWILSQANARLGTDFDSVADVAAAARGESGARSIFEAYGGNLAAIVAPWIGRFGADAIVLGGRITRAYDLFGSTLEAALADAGSTVSVAIHENTEDAAITGAGATFDEHFWREAKTRLPRR